MSLCFFSLIGLLFFCKNTIKSLEYKTKRKRKCNVKNKKWVKVKK